MSNSKENETKRPKELKPYYKYGKAYDFNRALFGYFFNEKLEHEKRNGNKITKAKLQEELAKAVSDKLGREKPISCHRVYDHLRPYGTKGAKKPEIIEIVEAYGEYLKGDEDAFLIEIPAAITDHSKLYKKIWKVMIEKLKVYQNNGVLNYLFTDAPESKKSGRRSDGKNHAEPSAFARLANILCELDIFFKSDSFPDVPDRWRKINPKINYFYAIWDIILYRPNDNAEGYFKHLQNLREKGYFPYYPSEDEIIKYKQYFEKRKGQSKEELFQQELIETLDLVLDNDFK